MRWLKGSAAMLVILSALAANFSDVQLPGGGTFGTRLLGLQPEAPSEIPTVQLKPRAVKAGREAEDTRGAQGAPAKS